LGIMARNTVIDYTANIHFTSAVLPVC